MLSMLISIESILYILFLEKYFFLKFYQYSPYQYLVTRQYDVDMKRAWMKLVNVCLLDYIAYSGEYTGAFSFSSENLNNSRVCRVFASEEFAECSS